jgi:hypothetical protein
MLIAGFVVLILEYDRECVRKLKHSQKRWRRNTIPLENLIIITV